MGTTAARNCRRIVNNLYSVLAFELMAAVQGIDLRKTCDLSAAQQSVYDKVRAAVPFYAKDEEIHPMIVAMNELIRSGAIENDVMQLLPDFH